MSQPTRWLEFGEPIGDDRVEAVRRTSYETGPNEELREPDVVRGTLPIERLDLLEDDRVGEHLHQDGSIMLSGLDDETEDELLEGWERTAWDRVEELISDEDLTPVQAVDYVAVEERGLSQVEWASRRGTSQGNVSDRVSEASVVLDGSA